MPTTAPMPGATTGPLDPRRGRLALSLQEAFTVVARLRADRQAPGDPDVFRGHVKKLLTRAEGLARDAGYPSESIRLAIYAYVALLDESVLTSNTGIASQWAIRPLQEEVFGDHLAGEMFFKHLEGLLDRPDSDELADVLEVFSLCLSLGFRGQLAAFGGNRLSELVGVLDHRIKRIRSGTVPLSIRAGFPSGEVAPRRKDRWVRRLLLVCLALVGVGALLLALYWFALGSGVGQLESTANQVLS